MNDPGITAVRAKWGPDMASHLTNRPALARVYTEAQNGDRLMIAAETEKAERAFRRIESDPDYALHQAETVARAIPRDRWGVVPSVAQLRREFGTEVQPMTADRLQRAAEAAERHATTCSAGRDCIYAVAFDHALGKAGAA